MGARAEKLQQENALLRSMLSSRDQETLWLRSELMRLQRQRQQLPLPPLPAPELPGQPQLHRRQQQLPMRPPPRWRAAGSAGQPGSVAGQPRMGPVPRLLPPLPFSLPPPMPFTAAAASVYGTGAFPVYIPPALGSSFPAAICLPMPGTAGLAGLLPGDKLCPLGPRHAGL